jgi:potassium efflux system protein
MKLRVTKQRMLHRVTGRPLWLCVQSLRAFGVVAALLFLQASTACLAQGPLSRLLTLPLDGPGSPQQQRPPADSRKPAGQTAQNQTLQSSDAPPNLDRPPAVSPAASTGVPAPASGDTESAAIAQDLLERADRLRKQREVLEQDPSIAAETKPRVFEQIDKAIEALERQRRLTSELSQLRQAAASVEERKAAVAKVAGEPIDLGLRDVEPAADVDALDAAKREAEQALAAVSEKVAVLTDRIADQRREAKLLPQQISDLEAKLDAIEAEPAVEEGAAPVLTLAIQAAQEAGRNAAAVELDVARQKVVTYDAEAELLPQELEQLQRRAAAATDAVAKISQRAARRRQDLIASRVEEFEEILGRSSEARQSKATVTVELLEQWSGLAKESRQRSDELTETKKKARDLQVDLDEMEALVASDLATGGGLSRSVGYLLQRTRGTLPSVRDISFRGAEQSRRVDDIQEMLAKISGRLKELPPPPVLAEGRAAEEEVDSLERQLLQEMDRDAVRFQTDTLIPLGVEQDKLELIVRTYENLIDRNLLWVRSNRFFDAASFWAAGKGLAGLLQWKRLLEIGQSIREAVADRWSLAALGGLLVLGLLVLRRFFVKQVVRLGSQATGRGALRLQTTFEAMAYTAIAATPYYLGFLFSSWFLRATGDEQSFTHAVAEALGRVANVLLPLEFLRQLVRSHGVASAHFAWPDAVTLPVRRTLRRSLFIALPCIFLWLLVDLELAGRDELIATARLLFIIVMLVVSAIFTGLAHPRLGIPQNAFKTNTATLPLGWLWRPLVIVVPLILAGLMAYGYGYSARQLAVSFYESIWIVVGSTVFHGLAKRWLLISRRRMALEEMRAKAAAREQAEALGVAAASGVELVEVNQLGVSEINEQTRRLIDALLFVGVLVGLWWIWSPVLPALGFLEQITLWELKAEDGTVTGAVTLASLLVAVPMVVLTVITVRNTPGLLEAAVLRHLPLDTPTRYAITSLASYVLAGLGLAVTAGTLGLSWAAIQWLVAGLSVGVGFGLQEIVANFICGIILLFEQPIRVGDVVTIDGVDGVVSRIRIRATTVTTWDRQEYIVPNKDLITGRVTNWTLSDSTNRINITVGVAYGTDTRRATTLIREICQAHPDVLREPETLITFEQFGDSTLNITIRAYLSLIEKRLSVIDDLHTAIHERFAAEGIEIAFPQLDVNLRREA